MKLPQALDLTSQYEVGLAEIQIPKSFVSVMDGEMWLQYFVNRENCEQPPERLTVSPHTHMTPKNLIYTLNRLIDDFSISSGQSPVMRFYLHKPGYTVTFKIFEEEGEVTFSERLKNMLGFPVQYIQATDPMLSGKVNLGMDKDIQDVYVYSNIVSARPVGDAMVPLLRTVPVLDNTMTSVFHIYDKPHYVPLSRFSFDTVEVLLTSEFGEPLPFKGGTSVLTLHFRTKRHFEN